MLGEGNNVDKFYINAMAKYIPNISDNKALGVRDHVRRGGNNVDKFYINAMVKDIHCKHK